MAQSQRRRMMHEFGQCICGPWSTRCRRETNQGASGVDERRRVPSLQRTRRPGRRGEAGLSFPLPLWRPPPLLPRQHQDRLLPRLPGSSKIPFSCDYTHNLAAVGPISWPEGRKEDPLFSMALSESSWPDGTVKWPRVRHRDRAILKSATAQACLDEELQP